MLGALPAVARLLHKQEGRWPVWGHGGKADTGLSGVQSWAGPGDKQRTSDTG